MSLLTSLHSRLWQVYPDHLALVSLARAEMTPAMGTLGLVWPRVKTSATDPEIRERGNVKENKQEGETGFNQGIEVSD